MWPWERCSHAVGDQAQGLPFNVVLFFASWPPSPGTMATNTWARQCMNRKQLSSISNLQIKEEKVKPDINGVIKTNATAEKTDEKEKEDRAAQSLFTKLIRSNLLVTQTKWESCSGI